MGNYVQYGCGTSCPQGWINFDVSPTLRPQRMSLAGRFFQRGPVIFPRGVRYGDIVKELPVADNSVDGIYASHVLEHLALADVEPALRKTIRLLKPGGIFRLVTRSGRPRTQISGHDRARRRPRQFVADAGDLPGAGAAAARHHRCRQGVVRPFGHSAHLWMWDEPSLREVLRRAGFIDIRRCKFNITLGKALAEVSNS